MKKSLIAVAVAGLFAAPVAMAEVTLSGAINVGIEAAKSSSVGTTPSLTRTFLNSNYSHMDLESVDDIGGGNKVILHYQLVATPQTAGDAPGGGGGSSVNRNSFLGVAGGWGAFKMGTNENVYERFMYTADPIDGALGPGGNLMLLGNPGGCAFEPGAPTGSTKPLGPTNPQACFYRRTDQTIWYESPNFSGFSFEVDYTLSAFKTAGPGAIDPKVISIGGKFQPDGAPFYVDLAYERHDDLFGLSAVASGHAVGGFASGTSSKDTGVQVGGGWSFGDLGLHARYEQLKYEETGSAVLSEYKRNAYWFAAKYNLPSGYVGAELGIAADGKANGTKVANTGAKIFGVGYFHNLSKQSQLQFIYGRTDNKDQANYVQAGGPNNGVLGSDHQVFHVGIKHTY